MLCSLSLATALLSTTAVADEVAAADALPPKNTIMLLAAQAAAAFCPHPNRPLHALPTVQIRRARDSLLLDEDDIDKKLKSSERAPDADDRQIGERLNALLDRSFFDPEDSKEGDPKLVSDFKSLFQADPEMASSLFVGLYFALLLFFAQQGIRVYKHCYFMPDKLCPWDVTPSIDDLLNF